MGNRESSGLPEKNDSPLHRKKGFFLGAKAEARKKKHSAEEEDPLSLYLLQIARFPLLDAQKEHLAGKEIQDLREEMQRLEVGGPGEKEGSAQVIAEVSAKLAKAKQLMIS